MSLFIGNIYRRSCNYVLGLFELARSTSEYSSKKTVEQAGDNIPEHSDKTLKETPQMERNRILALLRGSRIMIPNPQHLLKDWPAAVNPEVERLQGDIQRKLMQIFSNSRDNRRVDKMRATGIAHFGASWWPYARYDALFIGTCLSLWLFAWDDETDSLEYSNMSNDFERSCAFRRETMAYIEHSLTSSDEEELSQISTNPIITNFRVVGEAIRKSCDEGQAMAFLTALRFFVDMCEEEQALQISQGLPTIQQYTRRRMGSSGVEVCLAIQEYCFNMTIPEEVMQCESMKVIWRETNIIISTMNDMMSIKKEVDNAQIDTLIPLLFLQLGSVQGAIDKAAEMTKLAVQRFEHAERDIKTRYASDPGLLGDLSNFIDGCKYACTGNMNWSLTSGRYKLDPRNSDGPIEIVL